MPRFRLTSSAKLNLLLYQMGINDYKDVLNHLPRRYESFEYSEQKSLYHLTDKERIVIYGKVITTPKLLRFARLNNVSFYFRDEWGGDYKVVAWNRSYLLNMLNLKDGFTLSASYDSKRHELSLLNIKKGRIAKENQLVPIYSLPNEYPNHHFISLVEKALKEEENNFKDIIPPRFREKYRLLPKSEAIKKVHKPVDKEDIRQGSRVLKYEEALLFSLKNQIIRKENKALKSHQKGKFDPLKVEAFIASLPYSLTSSQTKVILEAYEDMNNESLMYRLLQGDVGSGKTLVAAILAYANYLRNAQSAFLAPTETLARQHYETLSSLFKRSGVKVDLLLGNMDRKDRKDLLSRLENGQIDVLVGTHALFSKDVNYPNLGLAIIDEQHKFGVNQRNLLASKGDHADVLLMSATPIPRSLAMTIYGDLDVSTLTEFPSGSKKIKTEIIHDETSKIDKLIKEAISNDKRIYIVAPRIEEGENKSSAKGLYAKLFDKYEGAISLLHGRMEEEEKLKAIEAFKSGERPILVSTSLIEVGIDVKKANLMFVYEPQSFALSSLHQLRGRIGRDGSEAHFYLVYEGNDPDELDKLEVLVETNDGFKIAEEDLRRRGPGEVAGTKQSGLPDFALLNIIEDFKMLEVSRDDATYIISHPNEDGNEEIIKLAKEETKTIILA